jgi:hypothetical protein
MIQNLFIVPKLTKFFFWLCKVSDQVFKTSDHFRQIHNLEETGMSLAGCHVIQAPKNKDDNCSLLTYIQEINYQTKIQLKTGLRLKCVKWFLYCSVRARAFEVVENLG